MKIRTQNLIAIPPLFVILAVATGGLAYWTAQVEIHWGIREESTSLAITTAELLSSTPIQDAFAGNEAALTEARAPLERILEFGQALRITVFSPDGTRPLLDVSASRAEGLEEEGPVVSLPPDPAFSEAMEADSVYAGDVVSSEDGEAYIVSYAPVRNSSGEIAAILAVASDAGRLETLTERVLFRFGSMSIAMTLVGVLAALFLTWRVSRPINELGRMARLAAEGDYDQRITVAGVQEVGDLANTLDTMTSILSDVLSRGRQLLVNGDPFRTSQGLTRAFRSLRGSPTHDRAPKSMHMCAPSVGVGHPGDFWGNAEGDEWGCAWVGRVEAEAPLDAALTASTLERIFDHLFQTLGPEAAAGRIAALFRPVTLQVAWWPRDRPSDLVVVSLGADGPIFRPSTGAHPTVLHNFDQAGTDTLDQTLVLFDSVPFADLCEELPRSLHSVLCGRLLVISHD